MLVAITLLAMAGCAGLAAVNPVGTVLSLPEGRALDRGGLAARLAAARLVLVGETHDHPVHHAVQREILELMAAGGGPLVVGVEWLDHEVQPACDRFSAGLLTVEEFAREVAWETRWGFPLSLYAPLLETIRQRRLPLVALNAPAPVVRQVARGGLASLAPGQRAALAPALDLEDPAYAALLAAHLAGHGLSDPAGRANFLAAQIVRDETMAERMAAALAPWPDGGRRGLVLCGSGHMAEGLGIPPRLARRLPGAAPLAVLLLDAGEPLPVRPPSPSPGSGVVIFTEPAPSRPPAAPRLGARLVPGGEGLLIGGVEPGSPAEAGGLQAGDLILALDDRPLARPRDLHDALREAPFATHRYTVLRRGERLWRELALPRPAPGAVQP